MASAARARGVTSGGMRSSASAMVAFVLAGYCRRGVEAFFPAIGPEVFEAGQKLPLFVNELTSTRTQVAFDHYHVGYCKPQHLHENLENIGAYLEGEREENSLYDLQVGVEKTCSVLCAKKLEFHERYMFGKIIADDYMAHMTVNGLPAAYKRSTFDVSDGEEDMSLFLRGYPVGIVGDGGQTFLHNHLRFTVAINERDAGHFHIVGFLVEPFSVQHQYTGPWIEGATITTCTQLGYSAADSTKYLSTDYDGEVLFTYDVMWDYTDMPWTQRWDIYSISSRPDNRIYLFTIINFSVIVLFLTVLVAMIIIGALCMDIQRYNAVDKEEASEVTGWKLVQGDVLRPPTTAPMLFAICVGTGVQLWSACFLLLLVRMVRLVGPLKRGEMLTVSILIYVLTGGIAGYNAAKIHRRFRGIEWLKMTTFSALAFPILSGSIFLFEVFQQWLIGSTGGAVPPRNLGLLVAMLLFVQMPLVFLGSFYGFKKEQPPQVVRTNQIPRMIPQTRWYVDPKVTIPLAGVLPFRAILMMLMPVVTNNWEQQPFFIVGFFVSAILLITVTCAEISIVMCYFQLCFEDYRWWWRSMLWSGSCAGWMFIYSIGYSFTALHTSGWMAASLLFGYNFVSAMSFFLLTGTVGYFSCQWFINAIYSSIKVD